MPSYHLRESDRDMLPSIHKHDSRISRPTSILSRSRGFSAFEDYQRVGDSHIIRPTSPTLRQGRSISPSRRVHIRSMSPTSIGNGRPVSPMGRPLSPRGRPLSPARPLSPRGRPLSPKGRPLSPRGRPLSPRARPLSPRGRPLSPVARPLSPGGRPLSPTGIHMGLHSRIGRSISPPPIGHYRDTTTLVQRPVSATYADRTRQQVAELQDQLRTYREELSKKDLLITQLTSAETPRVTKIDTSHLDEIYSNERLAAAAAAKSDIAALTVRVEGLQSQSRELQTQLDIREEKIRQLKMEVETARECEAKQGAVVQTLRSKLMQYESQSDSLQGAATRSEVAIQALQRQNRELQDRILEMESRIRSSSDDRGRMERERQDFELKYNELWTQLIGLVSVDGIYTTSSHDGLISRLTDIIQENAMLKGKIQAMKEYMSNAELETKASRETISRLVSDAEREQRTVSKYTVEMDTLRQDRDRAIAKHHEMQREIDVLKERLDASQRAWNATRVELEERESRFNHNDAQVREFEMQNRTMEQSFRSFKEQLAALLSDSFVVVEPYEEQIRERLTALVRSSTDRKAHIEMLEGKVASMTDQLGNQVDLQRTAEIRAQKVEGTLYSMEDKLRRAEGELAAGDMLRDGLRMDKERYLRFLEEICAALKMDPIAADMGLDSATDAILSRIQQVIGKETDALVDRKTHIYNLQRKIKTLKEQLDSKDLHMDLLRKKVASLEERSLGRSEMEREKEEEFSKNRKLLKLVDKYKRELNECRLEIRDYKARLLESADIRTRTLEQERELELLESKVGQLEHVRQKQAHKIDGLKSELSDTVSRFGEKKDVAHQTVTTLTSELRTLKQALQEMTNRERQLLDLRQVLARMLGLDVNNLAVPDYEIIARLEKLILANQSNAATVVALDTALEDVSDGFRVGYENAKRTWGTRSRSPVKVTRSMGSRSMGRSRARSMSPSRRRDYRQY